MEKARSAIKVISSSTVLALFLIMFLGFSQHALSESRQVSAKPFRIFAEKIIVTSPFVQYRDRFDRFLGYNDPGPESFPNILKELELLSETSPWEVTDVIREPYEVIYEDAVADGDDLRVIGSLAYLTGLANPLFRLEVMKYGRNIFSRSYNIEEFIVTYVLADGIHRYCVATVEKSKDTEEILRIDMENCERFVDSEQ